ncbi:MAG TPA: V-type ATPase 116kDa subunit family protein [Rectinemataceae bacterium]|nr:V-type ATPase 116kDa subunit family protein [Rectinemataceae bacterium]
MSILAMKKVEIVALRRDFDSILEILGKEGCFQPSAQKSEKAESDGEGLGTRPGRQAHSSPYAPALDKVYSIKRTLGLEFPETMPIGTRMPGPTEEEGISKLWAKVEKFDLELKENRERIAYATNALEEAKAFAGLNMPWTSLDKLSFLGIRIGQLNPTNAADIDKRMGAKAMLFPVDGKNLVVAVATKSGRFALDAELAKAGFIPKTFAADFNGVPLEVPGALEKELDRLESASMELETRRAVLKAELASEWQALAASYAVADTIETIKSGLFGSEQTLRLVGWMPKERVAGVVSALRKATGERIAFRTFAPREVESVRNGEEEVPVLMKKRFFVKNFERMVNSYMVPGYGSIDPTPFVAVFFTVFFSIMFGDVGQGFVIFAAGIALQFEWIKSLRKWKIFAPIVISAGSGSMFMGLLTGSFFSSETFLEPVEKVLTQLFLGHEQERFLNLLPGTDTIGTIMVFFGITLCIGVLVNSLGLIFNIVENIKKGRVGHAIFQKTGLCGAFFLWWAIGIAIRVLINSSFGLGWWDAVALGLPVVLLIFEEQLAALVDGHHYHSDDGTFANVIKAVVIVIETFSYYFSVTLSFLRIGAFALSHVVLSYVTFKMGGMVNDGSPLGFFLEALIVVLFNVIILVLEGMVVAIQVVRLQYYEFLSKFVIEPGTLFAPFRFSLSKE